MKKLVVHTDGACLGNPGPGGWAAILASEGVKKALICGVIATNTTRMEVQAAIQALAGLKEPCAVELFTDSEYLREGITKWIHAWKARGWKNKDLWQTLDAASANHKVTWHWARGHSGNPGNERCDLLSSALNHLLRDLVAHFCHLCQAIRCSRKNLIVPPLISMRRDSRHVIRRLSVRLCLLKFVH